jgi:hypothetical protein
MTFFIAVLLFILLVLAIAVAIHYRNESENLVVLYEAQRESDIEAWNQGRDELEELYQGEILTIGENWDACHGALEALYEVNSDLIDINRDLIHNNEGLHAEIGRVRAVGRTLEGERNNLLTAFEKVVDDHNKLQTESMEWEELYADAATELLETVTEIDKIAGEVHDWMGKGSPFD